MKRRQRKNGVFSATGNIRRNSSNCVLGLDENRRIKHEEENTIFVVSNTISNEIEGKCSKTHTFPSSSESSPTQNPDRLDAFLDFGGKNPPTVTHQMHRVAVRDGKPVFFDSPELAKARADICARLEQFTPDAPFEGPLALSVIWLFKDSRGREGWRDTKPDTDNLEKLLKDCMTRMRFWIDDAQVCDERVLKMWSKTPGICIVVWTL